MLASGFLWRHIGDSGAWKSVALGATASAIEIEEGECACLLCICPASSLVPASSSFATQQLSFCASFLW